MCDSVFFSLFSLILHIISKKSFFMFENLADKFERAFKVLKGQGQISEINVAETLKEVRRALLDADVNFKTAKEFTTKVKEKAIGRNVLTAISPGQLMTKICHEELVELMGGNEKEISYQGNPGVILMAGLQGSGKTTFSGKLANYLKTKKGKNKTRKKKKKKKRRKKKKKKKRKKKRTCVVAIT